MLLLLIIAVVLVGIYFVINNYREQKKIDEQSQRKLEQYNDAMRKQQDSLKNGLYNLKIATKMARLKIRLGMDPKKALEYQQHLIDSLNK
jgi:hypothetical protein